MNNENKFIYSGDDTTEQNPEILEDDSIVEPAIQQNVAKNQQKKDNVQNLINNGGSQVLQKMGIPKGIADKAIQKGMPTDRLGASNLVKNKLTEQIAKSPVGDMLGGSTNNQNEQQDSNTTDNSFSSNISSELKNKLLGKNKFIIGIILGLAVSLFFIMMIIVIFSDQEKTLSIRYFSSLMDGDIESSDKLYKYVSGCDSEEDEECKKKVNFYKYVNEQYYKYISEYSVEINRTLIIATLTYTSPYLTETQDVDEEKKELASNLKNYRKSIKQVDLLFENMVKQVGENCYVSNGMSSIFSIDCATKKNYEEGTIIVKPIYILDEEKYRKYLEDTFVIKYYLDNDKTEETKEEALEIVEEIYELYNDYVEYLNEQKKEDIVYSNEKVEIMVSVTNCNGTTVLEELRLSEYLEGVIYMYSDNDNENYLKFLAVAAKNNLYSINNANADNMPVNLRVRNCKANQLYCNVEEGCHYTEDENSTLVSGKDKKYTKAPASAQDLSKIQTAIKETETDFVTNNGSIVKTSLESINKQEVIEQLYKNSYKDVLANIYGGSVEEVDLYTKGYPLDLINNEVTSAYGWRFDPILLECKHHNGTDIAGNLGDNIYSIADGVVVDNNESASYGYYTVIGHGDFNNNTYEYYSLYAHQHYLSTIISVGDKVTAGQLIGVVGSSGWSTGAHLHIEIYTIENGIKNRTDPVSYFKNVDLIGKVGGPLYNSEQSCKAANP